MRAGAGCVSTGRGGGYGLELCGGSGDVGQTLRLVVTATNSAGSSSAASPGFGGGGGAGQAGQYDGSVGQRHVDCGSDGDGVAGGVVGQSVVGLSVAAV